MFHPIDPVSSFQSYSSCHISRFEMLDLFFSRVPSFPHYHREDPSKSLQGFTLCFQLLFLSIILFLPEFFIEALHGGSSRIPFILQLFFKISLDVMTRQAILKSKHCAQHMFCFEAFKHSSSCIPKCNSLYLIFGVMSFLIIFLRVSGFTSFQE